MDHGQYTSLPIRNPQQSKSPDFPAIHHDALAFGKEGEMCDFHYTNAGNPSLAYPSIGNPIAQPLSPSLFDDCKKMNPAPGSDIKMSIGRIGIKTRVENQIEVHIAIHPVDSSIKRLHLQKHTMTKAKHLAAPSPERSSDTLELHAMLVCSSAMNDPRKLHRAWSRAAQPQPFFLHRRSLSSGDTEFLEVAEEVPSEGGPVRLCQGCIEREIKRVARNQKPGKMHKQTTENLKLWDGDASNRAILFNANEIIERFGSKLPKKSNKSNGASPREQQNDGPEDAFMIKLPMRITCYCRHHEEKIGYRYARIAPYYSHFTY